MLIKLKSLIDPRVLIRLAYSISQSFILLLILGLQESDLLIDFWVDVAIDDIRDQGFWLGLLFDLIETRHEFNVVVGFGQVDHMQVSLNFLCFFWFDLFVHTHDGQVGSITHLPCFLLHFRIWNCNFVSSILELSVLHLMIKFVGVSQIGLEW